MRVWENGETRDVTGAAETAFREMQAEMQAAHDAAMAEKAARQSLAEIEAATDFDSLKAAVAGFLRTNGIGK